MSRRRLSSRFETTDQEQQRDFGQCQRRGSDESDPKTAAPVPEKVRALGSLLLISVSIANVALPYIGGGLGLLEGSAGNPGIGVRGLM